MACLSSKKVSKAVLNPRLVKDKLYCFIGFSFVFGLFGGGEGAGGRVVILIPGLHNSSQTANLNTQDFSGRD